MSDSNSGCSVDGVVYTKGVVEQKCNRLSDDRCSFFLYWEKRFKTLDVSLVHSEEPPANTINCRKYSRYREDYKGPHIVMNGADTLAADHPLVAVLDSQNPTRAFIGQEIFDPVAFMCYLVGGICYFDDQGKMDGAINAFRGELIYDRRNDYPRWSNLFLCGSKLSFVWRDRDDFDVALQGWLIGENDHLVGQYGPLTKWSTRETSSESHLLEGRWLCCLSALERTYYCVDLFSIRRGSSSDETIFDTLTIKSTLDPKTLVQSLRGVPSYENTEIEGYPVRCVRCGQPTVRGSLNWLRDGGVRSTMGLGRGVCEHCLIRYSKSSKKWICWKIIKKGEEGTDCRCPVSSPGFQCTAEHADPKTLSFRIKKYKRKRSEVQDEIEAYL